MPPSRKKPSNKFDSMRRIFFFSILGLLGVGLLYLFRPFFYPIFWAAVIAVMFYPLYKFLGKYITIPSLNTMITILLIIVTLFIPLSLITFLTTTQSINLYQTVTTNPETFLDVNTISTRFEGSFLEPLLLNIRGTWVEYANQAAEKTSLFIFENTKEFFTLLENIKNLTTTALKFIAMVFIMFYCLYYFLKDGKSILEKASYLSPLGDKYEHKLFEKFTSTTKATLKSTLIVGGIQGALGGIIFWITGIEGAFVWAIIMVILSIIPAIGAFLVWFPAGVIMLALGNTWEGILILLFGGIVISMIDNLLRPPLIGKDTQMHPVIILFSTLGGIIVFGVSGFVIGPIIAALFLSVLSIYSEHYKKDLQRN
ncbi:MAG: AI-2E family transporter [Candidatus Magasanikbacteria bacterium]|jgi:predicted PurR-regulated permease PerM|nr:AI-2E family transporter [Candidatus Magasanikbacteria bacterium]MBT4220988.1 AI-2E family transporter [Candidatus Magasanikbacteria bacterium]MBT4350506.1 AI-2E family transporter [Candidatus Magasanikbacteria bacterium]MBT4541941.1 AI-2E family transporter [Candidatus Magasanikbacteria bacterium]MBT6252893.1 AI-2E family transporter [Candidatus Magasanikbacteria bacterium]